MRLKKLLFGIIGTAALIASSVFCGCDFTAGKQEEGDRGGNGGAIVSAGESAGIELTSVKLMADEYEENGVSALAETAYTLTATIKPETTSNKLVNWSVAFANAESAWASGKSVTDYVTVTPTSSGALTATVACLAPFGEQIKVTVTSRDNAEAKADCTVDYAKKITDISKLTFTGNGDKTSYGTDDMALSVGAMTLDFDMTATGIEVVPVYSDYTLEDSFSYTYTYQYESSYISNIESAGWSDYLASDASSERSFDFVNGFKVGRYVGGNILTSTGMNLIQTNAIAGNKYAEIIQNTNGNLFTVKVTATGSYSTYVYTKAIVAAGMTYNINAETVSLSLTSLVF